MPLYYEIKDQVREHLARTTFPSANLDQALAQGRRIVEQAGNWYWMRAETFFQVVPNQQIYPINSSGQASQPVTVRAFSSNLAASNQTVTSLTPKVPTYFQVQPIDVPGFKDIRAALAKQDTDLEWDQVESGGITKEEADLHYAINDSGKIELVLLDNLNLLLYPPFPDKAYWVYLYYWQWTDNPKGNLKTDELVNRFPEALMYASLVYAYEQQLKDTEGAGYWRTLLGGKPGEIGYGGEIAKIRRHNFQRMRQDNMQIQPLPGPNSRSRRLRLTQNIWLGSGGRW